MLSLTVSRKSGRPLADQIVAGIKRQIDDRHLRPGTKLPSIRNFAESYKVSRFTVVEAYDRLVAMGCLQSRRGAGFYTAPVLAPAEKTWIVLNCKRGMFILSVLFRGPMKICF